MKSKVRVDEPDEKAKKGGTARSKNGESVCVSERESAPGEEQTSL